MVARIHRRTVYSYYLFLISSASVRSIPFVSFIKPIFAWNIPLLSQMFLKRSLVFPILLFSSISLHWSLRKAFISLLAILWNSAFKWVYLSFSLLPFASLLFSATWEKDHFSGPQTTILPFCISFSRGWSWSLLPEQCHKPLCIVLQALCLWELIPWMYFSLSLYNHKGYDLDHTWMV